jgi:hypothetical protein
MCAQAACFMVLALRRDSGIVIDGIYPLGPELCLVHCLHEAADLSE